jgi:hypothetical protein
LSQYTVVRDRNERKRTLDVDLEPKVLYGQLEEIYKIHFHSATSLRALGLVEPTTIIMAAIRNCAMLKEHIQGLGSIGFYKSKGKLDVVDVTTIDGLVGRVKCGGMWAIIDRNADTAKRKYDHDLGMYNDISDDSDGE